MGNALSLRKDANRLQPEELLALHDAYRKMQAISAADNRSWIYWAGQHGFPNFGCWHHGRSGFTDQMPYDLFLPWHRAFLLYWEHAMRDQNPLATLPWWDWSTTEAHQIGVPTPFAGAQLADGTPNPLNSGPMPAIQDQPARMTQRFPGNPTDLPSNDAVDRLMGLGSFVDFTSQVQDLHDMVHGWSGGLDPNDPQQGGDMGNIGTAAFDPIFWSHHCMIDRIWYLWQLRNGNGSMPPEYLGKPLAPFALTVKDVLSIQQLGYEYAASSVTIGNP